jgi:DNA-binding transcriptional LysR family regulator
MEKEKSQNFFYKNNRLQQMRGFYYAVRSQNISHAAKELELSQSTISLQIKSLEDDLGIKLLDRGNKDIFLTKDGEEFYEMACPLIQEFESIAKNFQLKKTSEKRHNIKIAVHHVAISYLMPKVIANFRKIYPEINIILQNVSPNEAIDRIIKEESDIAIFPNLQKAPELELIEVASYKPILIMSKNNPLKDFEIKSLQDLKRYNLIRIDKNLITLPLFEEAFKTYGYEGSIEFENGNWEMLTKLVKKNDFAAIVSTICVENDDRELISLDLSDLFPDMTYFVAIKNKIIQSDIVRDFIFAVNDAASNHKTCL